MRTRLHNFLKNIPLLALSLLLALGMVAGCEGPVGEQGAQGPEGPQGPVGPAGEDGSIMYSGQGAPGSDIGSEGDYYLNTNTGEMYGPKDGNGWGQPIMVLMGDDGQDGEDGSQIYSGNSAPGSSLGKVGDYYLDKSSYELYGPKTSSGWGTPISLRGSQGPAGPAGEDGSVMYSGQGAPGSDIGSEGDYYLNTNTGEMYGPKDGNGWGQPIMVLMGDDGQDGEDGSQIYSGNSAPGSSLGKVGDYYLDKSSYELYGPKTSSGWGTPISLKGADGNANVTRYIFPGYDFSSLPLITLNIDNMTQSEFRNTKFLTYFFVPDNGTTQQGYYPIPGYGRSGITYYRLNFYHYNGAAKFIIKKRSGDPGEQYGRVEIVSIGASNTEDNRKVKGSEIPNYLDTSDYEAVAEYYGFYR
ncbi:MAG: hypothetical protein U5J63_11380 [Fodinibius sp.]|nr:hypothetical protein [Fodinibius sp.]